MAKVLFTWNNEGFSVGAGMNNNVVCFFRFYSTPIGTIHKAKVVSFLGNLVFIVPVIKFSYEAL